MSDTNRAADSKSQRRGLESDGANPSELCPACARRTVRLGDIVLVAEHIRGFQVIIHTARLPYSVPRHRVIVHVAGYGPIEIDDYPTREAAVGYLDMLERELEEANQ